MRLPDYGLRRSWKESRLQPGAGGAKEGAAVLRPYDRLAMELVIDQRGSFEVRFFELKFFEFRWLFLRFTEPSTSETPCE
jgi:hypothetical protein